MSTDPACGMEVDPSHPSATAEYGEHTYYFCSEGCKERFETEPERFATAPPHLSERDGVITPRLSDGTHGRFELDVAVDDRIGVGDEVSVHRTIREVDVRKFAEATGDTNAVHLNEQFARETRFGRRIVHGTLVAGLISASLASLPGVSIYLEQSLRFRRPVVIGETVTARCRIEERLDDDRFRLETIVETADGDRVIEGGAEILVDEIPALTVAGGHGSD